MFSTEQCDCVKTEIDIFAVPPLNTSMERGFWTEHLPISTLSQSGPIEFHITASDEEYIDIGRTLLYVKASIRNGNAELTNDDKIGPVNLWLHSLFSQVDVKLNGTLVTPSVNTYPYKAYLETMLCYGHDAKNTHLSSQGWAEDTAGKFNDVDAVDGQNAGLKERYQLVRKAPWTEFMGRLHCDIFQQEKYLMNGVDLDIKLVKSQSNFNLIGADRDPSNYKVVIDSAGLFIRRVKLSPSVIVEHNKLLNGGQNAKIPLRRGIVNTFTIPAGTLSKSQDNIIQGQLPRRIILGLVRNDALNGSTLLNPYNFEHFRTNYMSITVDGRQIPSQPYQPNFDSEQYLRSYLSLFEATGMLNDNRGNGIGRSAYPNGFMLHAFDLTPDGSDGNFSTPIQSGSLKIDIHFGAALEKTVNVVMYCEYENTITIDRARNVITDF